MTGLRPMLRKELWEISRTWRRFVFPLVIAFFAITGPVAARLLPTLMRSTMGGHRPETARPHLSGQLRSVDQQSRPDGRPAGGHHAGGCAGR